MDDHKDLDKRPISKLYKWLPSDPSLNPFYHGICDFVDKYAQMSTKRQSKPKEILDPCVGYVSLNSWEIAILDTQLFQRLRKITQLGMADMVYPTLTYSRFQHTIGVLGRLEQVLTNLKEKHRTSKSEKNNGIINESIDKYETQIRIAALFHDVGHCLFSHLSESVMSKLEGKGNYPSASKIQEVFKEHFTSGIKDISVFEIISITILGTKQIGKILFENHFKKKLYGDSETLQSEADLGEVLHNVSRLIAGLPIENDPRTIFLAQLMSSGLDVDKLDYMSREEHFSGIKIEMDLQRIYNKMMVKQIPFEEIPESLNDYTKCFKHDQRENSFLVLGIEKGGQFAYEEFCLARLALYEKIYLHKKVRAAESFLKLKLSKLPSVESEYAKVHNWLFLPESIIERSIYEKISVPLPENRDTLFPDFLFKEDVKDLKLQEVKDRKIPHRAFGFGPANSKTDDKSLNSGDFKNAIKNKNIYSITLWEELRNDNGTTELSRKIIEEAIIISNKIEQIKIENPDIELEIRTIKDKKIKQKDIEVDDISFLENSLVVDIPNYKKVELDPETLYFEGAGYQSKNWTIPIDVISDYYLQHRILAYVFVDHSYCPLITLATERVIFKHIESTKLVFDQNGVISSDVLKIANKAKEQLRKAEFYKDYEEIIPLNDDMDKTFAKELMYKVIDNLKGLSCLKNRTLSFLDIENFIRQFKHDIQLPALQLISNLKVLSPKDELIPFLKEKFQNPHKFGVLPLGSYMNSSSNMYKELKPYFTSNGIVTLKQDSDLSNIDEILLIDDNINTGIQCLNLFSVLLGCDSKELKRNNIWIDFDGKDGEISQADSKFVEEIKTKKLNFVFITGHEKSDKKLEEYLIKYCGIDKKYINIYIKHKLHEDDKIFSGKIVNEGENIFRRIKNDFRRMCNEDKRKDLKDFLTEVGSEIVKDEGIVKKYNQPSDNHSMGYNNNESLIIFASSIPTMTITALWCKGIYQGKEWIPLISRNVEI